jgi:hypothetical protein
VHLLPGQEALVGGAVGVAHGSSAADNSRTSSSWLVEDHSAIMLCLRPASRLDSITLALLPHSYPQPVNSESVLRPPRVRARWSWDDGMIRPGAVGPIRGGPASPALVDASNGGHTSATPSAAFVHLLGVSAGRVSGIVVRAARSRGRGTVRCRVPCWFDRGVFGPVPLVRLPGHRRPVRCARVIASEQTAGLIPSTGFSTRGMGVVP